MNQKSNNLFDRGSDSSDIPIRDIAETLCHHLALDQQVLLRLFGRRVNGELNDDQFVALLRSFSLELPWRKRATVEALARGIESGESFIGAVASLNSPMLGRNAHLRMMEKALVNAQDQNSLPAFLHAVSTYQPSRRPLALLYHDTVRKKMIRLVAKTAVILQLVLFLMLFIVPEFMKIFDEFGIELPYSFLFVVKLFDLTAKYWFLLLFLLILIFRRFLFPRAWFHLLRQMIMKFNPWSWQHRLLSKSQQQELSVALSSTLANSDFAALRSLSRKERQALEMAHSENAKSWLVSRRVREDGQRRAVWKNCLRESFIGVWNVALACIVAAVAISIVSCLITIIQGVSDGD